jgi:hypothetical protein
MFEEILGLPAHPLIIHAAVVLTPLLAGLAIVYALAPRTRGALAWAVVLLSITAPAAVFAAKESGEAFVRRLFADGQIPPPVTEHESFATPLLLATAGLGLASLLLVYAARTERFGKVAVTALSGVAVVLALVVGFYVLRAGHTGAVAVWG